jgi:hypothetical protein
MILIFISFFVTLYNKNVFLSSTIDFPVILDGQISSGQIKKDEIKGD